MESDSVTGKKVGGKEEVNTALVPRVPTLVPAKAMTQLNFADPCANIHNIQHNLFLLNSGPIRYKVKSEKYFRTSILRATFDTVVKQVKSLLAEAHWMLLAMHVWSNPTMTYSVHSFTGHFLDGLCRHQAIISALVLKRRHKSVGTRCLLCRLHSLQIIHRNTYNL